ncbi:MAG: RNA polymerase sigma-70 factor [Tannerellaceae bacterium]|jgi:RNA polymerase sigma-70 factor (ECF subfamily)|nr:RNA polymerase sigma-70 factor [Tannerellaceae bacterium]
MSGASNDNTAGLNELYRKYNDRFVRFAKTYVVQKETAEDIVMESFMCYWENRRHLAPNSNAPAYITTLIKNKCLNHLRHLRTQQEIERYITSLELWELELKIATLEACNPEKLFSEEVQQLIDKTLAALPPKTHDVFLRSRYHDQSHREISQSLGLSEKSVEYHITKALKLLRTALKDYASSC